MNATEMKKKAAERALMFVEPGMKLGAGAGPTAAAFALFEAQRAVADVCRAANVEWRFFHGRGTSLGRGGGPADRGDAAVPLPASAKKPDRFG